MIKPQSADQATGWAEFDQKGYCLSPLKVGSLLPLVGNLTFDSSAPSIANACRYHCDDVGFLHVTQPIRIGDRLRVHEQDNKTIPCDPSVLQMVQTWQRHEQEQHPSILIANQTRADKSYPKGTLLQFDSPPVLHTTSRTNLTHMKIYGQVVFLVTRPILMGEEYCFDPNADFDSLWIPKKGA
jgi:hypothetical protein